MNPIIITAQEYAAKVREFPLGNCGPSDDPDMETAYVYGFRELASLFCASAKRIGDPDLSSMIADLKLSPDNIIDAYDLRIELLGIIDYFDNASSNEGYIENVTLNSSFLNIEVLAELQTIKNKTFDITKLVRFCEEINDAYARANYLSCVLLIRAVMNHVPPLFNQEKFSQVVANSSRSIKAVLSHLEANARPIADLHTHFLIRSKEQLPTKHQIEPYKSSFEILIQEIIVKLNK